MKVIEIPLYNTFTIWIATVFVGSIILPFTVPHTDVSPQIMVMCMAVSLICSIPAFLILLLIHYFMNRRQFSINKHQFIQNVFHLAVSITTFLTFPVAEYDSLGGILVSASIVYPIIAFTIWNLVYWRYRTKEISNENNTH